MAHSSNRLAQTATLGASHVVVVSNRPYLIGSALVVRECAEDLGVMLCPFNVQSVQVATTCDGVGEGARDVTVNDAIRLIKSGLGHLHEVSVLERVAHHVLWLERVGVSLALPLLLVDVFVVN